MWVYHRNDGLIRLIQITILNKINNARIKDIQPFFKLNSKSASKGVMGAYLSASGPLIRKSQKHVKSHLQSKAREFQKATR